MMYYTNDDVISKLGVDCVVTNKAGEKLYALNANLIMKNNLTTDDVTTLKILHAEKHEVFSVMERTEDPATLKQLAATVKELEFEMQKAWHFPQDETMHEWYRVPRCRCPKMDNADRRGTNYQITSADCPIHGFDHE